MMTARLLAAVAVLLSTAGLAAAGEPTERLRTFFDRANRIILAPDSEGGVDERIAAVRGLVTEVFDFDGAAALALGRRWDTLTPAARATFTRLYADVVERAYLAWVGSKARVGEGGVSVRWLEEVVERDAATVHSVLLTRAGGELPIDYRLVRRDSDWLVRDVVVDGVSLAANYRVQFERILQLGSYDELLARLREKAGPAAREEAEAAGASWIRTMAAPAGGDAIAAPRTSLAPTRVVAEIRDTHDVVASDARAMVGADVRVSALVPPAPALEAAPRPAATVSAPVRAAAAVASSARPGGAPRPAPQFWVQVGAFRTIDAAAQLVRRLHDHAVTIAIAGDRPTPLTRVLVGPFAERSTAASVVRALHAGGFAAFIAE